MNLRIGVIVFMLFILIPTIAGLKNVVYGPLGIPRTLLGVCKVRALYKNAVTCFLTTVKSIVSKTSGTLAQINGSGTKLY